MNARTALVTGANRGLGLETCRQLARRGFRVLLTSRGEQGQVLARRLVGEGLPVEPRSLDVVEDASVLALAAQLSRERVAIDVLVNNAGIALDGFDAEVARRTLDVNFFGALRVTEGLLGLMPAGGNIVMVSSGMGELAGVAPRLRDAFSRPDLTRGELLELMTSFLTEVERGRWTEAGWPSSAYRVSKIGLNALTRVLARDLAGRIRVNAVCPGWVQTDMGGRNAPRGVEEGAASIVWAAALEAGPTGGFFRDGQPIPW